MTPTPVTELLMVPPKFHNRSLRLNNSPRQSEHHATMDVQQDDGEVMSESINEIREPELDTPEEREKFYQEVCIPVLQS